MKETLIATCTNRDTNICCEGLDGHKISTSEVHHKLVNVIDLVHVEERYHRCCFRSIMRGESSARDDQTEEKKLGRPKDTIKHEAFERTCEWVVSEPEPRSLQSFPRL